MSKRIRKGEPGFEEFCAKRNAYMREWSRQNKERLRSYYENRKDEAAAKGILCACGCGEIVTSASKGAKFAKGHWTLGKEFGADKRAVVTPTTCDIYWAAGFLEGEGSFTTSTGSNRYPVSSAQVRQVQKEPLERLRWIFGGRISIGHTKKTMVSPENGKAYNCQPIHAWYTHQARARGIMMTVYSLMSPKRQEQIRKVLTLAKHWEKVS